MDQVKLTRHSVPLTTKELIEELNPVVGVWATITRGECRSPGSGVNDGLESVVSDQIHNRFAVPPWLAFQVRLMKETVFDSIPLSGARRIMAYRNHQADLVCQILQIRFPGSASAAVASSRLRRSGADQPRATSCHSRDVPGRVNSSAIDCVDLLVDRNALIGSPAVVSSKIRIGSAGKVLLACSARFGRAPASRILTRRPHFGFLLPASSAAAL
jgi:hypothetical protein